MYTMIGCVLVDQRYLIKLSLGLIQNCQIHLKEMKHNFLYVESFIIQLSGD